MTARRVERREDNGGREGSCRRQTDEITGTEVSFGSGTTSPRGENGNGTTSILCSDLIFLTRRRIHGSATKARMSEYIAPSMDSRLI